MVDNYIALGDSISISSYPSLDAGMGSRHLLGAADLTGLELSVKLKHVNGYYNLAADGAITTEVFKQVRFIPAEIRRAANIISLTAGGNDISFVGMDQRGDMRKFANAMEVIQNRYDTLLNFILETFPNSMVIINTLYDPTDGTGELPDCGSWSNIAEWYSKGRRQLGDYIRGRYGPTATIFGNRNRLLFCDIFKLFDGHGMKEGNPRARWYYSGFLIEPGATGAREIANAWVGIVSDWIAQEQALPTSRITFTR